MYFDKPTQVIFADPDNPGAWLKGIGYKDEVLCACCGGVFTIDYIEKNKTSEKGIYLYSYWEDLSDAIYGGELPEGLGMNIDYKIVEVGEYDDESTYEQTSFLDSDCDSFEEEDTEWIEYFNSQFFV